MKSKIFKGFFLSCAMLATTTALAAGTLPRSFYGKWISVQATPKTSERIMRQFCNSAVENPLKGSEKVHMIEFDANRKEFLVMYADRNWGMDFDVTSYKPAVYTKSSSSHIQGTARTEYASEEDELEKKTSRAKFDIRMSNNQIYFEGRTYKQCP